MITNRQELKEYLMADKIALGKANMKAPGYGDLIWRYEISLRKCEYYTNVGGIVNRIRLVFETRKRKFIGTLCGFEIPLNCIGKGLSIAHKGPIIINKGASIGENCRLHICVVIGTAPGCAHVAPKIGDNVYIGPGVKMYGDIQIASGIIVGANSVVTKSFDEESICIAGVPAQKISDYGRFELEKRNRERYGSGV